MKKFVIMFCALILIGCATGTGSTLMVGNKRPPIIPSQVKVYFEPPAKFEVIAMIHASSEDGFSKQESQDYALEELKNRCAEIGANGVIIEKHGFETVNQITGVPVYGGGTIITGGSVDVAVFSGKAIFVIQE